MSQQILDVIWIIAGACGLAVLSLAVNRLNGYLQQRLTKDQYDYMTDLVGQIVDAAEQKYKAGSLSGENRIVWVQDQLFTRLPGVPSSVIEPLIQAQVRRVNLENSQAKIKS